MNEEKNKYKVLEWNINMRSAGEYIPKFVSEAIIEQKADIVILTEFVFCDDQFNEGLSYKDFLDQTFTTNGYDHYPKSPTKNTDHEVNEVVIAWNKDKFNLNEKKQIFSAVCSRYNNIPNFLTVPLVTNDSLKKELRVAGVRITMTTAKVINNDYVPQAKLRFEEMEMVYSVLDKITNNNDRIIIAGDLNNYRRGTTMREWNFNRITCNRGDYTPYTPNGDSWDGNGTNSAPEDHFITKNCSMKDYEYDRQFTHLSQKQNGGIYNAESLYKTPSPYPDHAMLIGMLIL